MADLFQTSVSGMLAFQQSLATTSHNISNVNTPGYSRQRTELSALAPSLAAGGWMGNGVGIDTIRRMVDENRLESVRSNSSSYSRLQTFAELSGRIDALLADRDAGLAPALQGFFDSVQQAASDPTSATSKEVLLTEAQNLTSRFQYMDSRMQELEDEVNARIEVVTEEVNQLAESIARLNGDIAVALGRSQGAPPNDLLDKRDALMEELSQRVTTNVVRLGDGSVNIFIGSGQALVVGNDHNEIGVVRNDFDASRNEIAFVGNNTTVNITRALSGGTLGGLLDFRRESLDTIRNELGQLATSVALQFNAQHGLGVSFDNGVAQLGGDFFSLLPPEVLPGQGMTATGSPTVAIDAATVTDLTSSDYRLQFDGGANQWVVTRLSDLSTTNIAPGGAAVIDGVAIDTGGIAGQVDGDSFLIRPTLRATNGLAVALSRASQVAGANPVLTGEAVDGTGQSANTGTGSISAASIGSQANLPLAGAITLTFDATTNQFIVTGGPGGTLAYNPATDSGTEFNFPAYGDMRFTLSGVPEDGDAFVISPNTSGRGDNANLLALADLRNTPTMEGDSTSYQQFYSTSVGRVGAQTMRANVNRDAQESLLNQAIAYREEVSGVNLEEEAANMLRYQQAFQASAQMVTVAQTVFQSLIDSMG